MARVVGLESVCTIDQREIQKRGGKCSKYPVSCLIYNMLSSVGLIPESLVVLDVTYGVGNFYRAWHPKVLIGSDVKIWRWEIAPDVFILQPSWNVWWTLLKLNIKPDIIVIDPPWSSNSHRGRTWYNYSFGTPEQILRGGLESAAKLGIRYALIHYNKVVVPKGWKLVKAVKFIYVSRYLKNNDIENNPNHTYFYILKRVFD